MSIPDIQRRLEEAQRERTRLEMSSGRVLQELSRLERTKIDTISEMRKEYEKEVAIIEGKMNKEIDEMRKDHDRTVMPLRSNNIMVLNAERELENARKNENPSAVSNRRRL